MTSSQIHDGMMAVMKTVISAYDAYLSDNDPMMMMIFATLSQVVTMIN